MSHITELLKKQADAIKQKSGNFTAAAHLRKAADALESEANKPVKLDFKAIVREKEARIAKFNVAMKQMNEANLKEKLRANGWNPFVVKEGNKFFSAESGIQHYSNHKKSGCAMIIRDGKFTVVAGKHVVQPEISLKFLDEYLAKP